MATATYIAMTPRPAAETFRRRRIVAGVFATVLAASAGVAVQDGLADRGGDPASTAAISQGFVRASRDYVVQPGDTLWAIAEQNNRGGDIVGYVDALVRLNGGTVIVPGQRLSLP